MALGAASAALLAQAPPAHADIVQEGQPCYWRSAVVFLDNGSALLCGPEVHHWVPLNVSDLGTPGLQTIGYPCHVPSDSLALGQPVQKPLGPLTGNPNEPAVYLVRCIPLAGLGGRWGLYAP